MKPLFVFLVSLILFSCNKKIEPESPEVLFDKYKGSVVLVYNQYYYVVENNGVVFFYSPDAKGQKIFFSEQDAIENASQATGTGFMISDKGEIITNRHVVSPSNDGYIQELTNLTKDLIEIMREQLISYSDSILEVESYYRDNSYYLSYDQKSALEARYDNLQRQKTELAGKIYNASLINVVNSNVRIVNLKLAIAFNDTYVTNIDDLQDCVLVKSSEKENVDLALIQTKNKRFENPSINIVNFDDNNPNVTEDPETYKARDIKDPIKINEDVFMIGFNRGFILANTKQGIKSQFTSGKISQESDGERILYTIPTLEGSSGSPIIDKWGNLVGVNFAKLTNSQSFSFGIPVAEVKKFYDE